MIIQTTFSRNSEKRFFHVLLMLGMIIIDHHVCLSAMLKVHGFIELQLYLDWCQGGGGGIIMMIFGIFFFLARLYRKCYCTVPNVGVGGSMDKMLKFYIKVFM